MESCAWGRPCLLRVLLAGLTGLLWLVVAGCERTVPVAPRGSATVLYGVVVSEADSVFLTLGRARGSTERGPEPGARLELSVDGREILLREGPVGACGDPVSFSCYRGRMAAEPAPGDVVELRGELASGLRVTGRAVVPDAPGIRLEGAGPGDTVRAGSRAEARPAVLGLDDEPRRVSLGDTSVTATVWADGAALRCPVRLPGPAPRADLTRAFTRVFVSANAPRCPGAPDLAWDSMAVPVTFLAYDRNFTEWAGTLLGGSSSSAFGVTGVEGVFGAATPRTFVMIVTP